MIKSLLYFSISQYHDPLGVTIWSVYSHTFMLSSLILKRLFYAALSITAINAGKKNVSVSGSASMLERVENDE